MGELFFEILFEIISYPVGWCVCRLITFGQYPRGGFFDYDSRSEWANLGIMLVGLITTILGLGLVFKLF